MWRTACDARSCQAGHRSLEPGATDPTPSHTTLQTLLRGDGFQVLVLRFLGVEGQRVELRSSALSAQLRPQREEPALVCSRLESCRCHLS